MISGFFNDLFSFDPLNKLWEDLKFTVKGGSPHPRFGHGFASLQNLLFVFAGFGADGIVNIIKIHDCAKCCSVSSSFKFVQDYWAISGHLTLQLELGQILQA